MIPHHRFFVPTDQLSINNVNLHLQMKGRISCTGSNCPINLLVMSFMLSMVLRISPANAYMIRNGSTRSLSRLSVPCCFTSPGMNKNNLKHKKSNRSSLTGNSIAFKRHQIYSSRLMMSSPSKEINFEVNEENWREHPSLTETLMIPTIIVPSEHLHSMMSSDEGLLGPILSSNMEELENIHPRIKQIQNLDKVGIHLEETDGLHSKKAILLDPRKVGTNNREMAVAVAVSPNDGIETSTSTCTSNTDLLSKAFPLLQEEVIQRLASKSASPGPMVPISLNYKQQTIQRILTKLLPEEAQPPPTGYEQIGHVVHLNLKRHHEPYRKLIGSVILDRLPLIETVVNKIGEVSGPYRTYDMEFLAGKPDTMVRVNEDGVSLDFDLRKVYWCTRLSGERKRLLDEFNEGDVVADAFCGAGAFVVQAAVKLGCTVYANDLNPDAVKYCRENARKNLKRYTASPEEDEDGAPATPKNKPIVKVTCGDAFDFIQNLGNMEGLPHHVVMNFPLDSPSFLVALRWWTIKDEMEVVPTIHLYTFARSDDPKEDGINNDIDMPPRDAAEVAVDLIAEALLPEGGAIEVSKYRRSLLDRMGCDVKTKEVRDVAPGKVVIYVSFKVTDTLLRSMQGDFIDF